MVSRLAARAVFFTVTVTVTGPMMGENETGSVEVDMDNSGFAGKPPAATNS